MSLSAGQIVLGILFGAAGSFLIWTGAYSAHASWRMGQLGHRAVGRVTDLREEFSRSGASGESGKGGAVYFPIIEFTDATGRRWRVETGVGTSPPAFERQQIVNVLYDARNPRDAQIDAFSERWLMPLLLLAGGTVLLSIAMAVAIFNIPVGMQVG